MSGKDAEKPDMEEGKSSTDGNSREHPVALRMPGVDCVEKIVIILDLSPEMKSTHVRSPEKRTLLHLTKRALETFVQNKHGINKKHEFALMIFRDTVEWLVDFQSSPEEFLRQLNHCFPIDTTPPDLDLASIFDTLANHVEMPQVVVPNLPPSYVVRAILVYGRSHTLPTMSDRKSFTALQECPGFFLDILYVHEKPSDENKCLDIYQHLCALDESENTYILEVSSSMTRLLEVVCILLGHPMQRPPQADALYTLTG